MIFGIGEVQRVDDEKQGGNVTGIGFLATEACFFFCVRHAMHPSFTSRELGNCS